MPKYTGKISPANAMSALDPQFQNAYNKAADAFLAATIEFEHATGRIVDSIGLNLVDITTVGDLEPQHVRLGVLHFLPTHGEVDY